MKVFYDPLRPKRHSVSSVSDYMKRNCRLVEVVKAHGKCRIAALDTGSSPILALSYSDAPNINNISVNGSFAPFRTIMLQRCSNQEQFKQDTL